MKKMTKDEKARLAQRLADRLQKKQDKERLLQYTQKYYIGGGNNSQLIRNIIKQRYWWTPARIEDFGEANFIWTSWKKDKHIQYLKNKAVNELDQPLKVYSRMDNNK